MRPDIDNLNKFAYACKRKLCTILCRKAQILDKLVQVLQDNGGSMPFPAFVAAVRAAGGNPMFWLKAKHAGLLETEITVSGAHVVSLPASGGA